MLHIQEYVNILEHECNTATGVITQLIRLPHNPMNTDVSDIVLRLAASTKEFDTLAQELRLRSLDVERLKAVVIEQMETSRNFWNTVLAFLVALYVPLSFASVRVYNLRR